LYFTVAINSQKDPINGIKQHSHSHSHSSKHSCQNEVDCLAKSQTELHRVLYAVLLPQKKTKKRKGEQIHNSTLSNAFPKANP
jgi:hypothetical protein